MAENKSLNNLQSLLDAMDKDRLGKDEFTKHFQKVIDVVKKNQERNAQAITDLESTYKTLLDRVNREHNTKLSEFTGKTNENAGNLSKKLSDEHTERMLITDDKIKMVEEVIKQVKDGEAGKPGVDGKDGSPDNSEEVRDKLEKLVGDERLDVGAIRGLDKLKKEIVRSVPMKSMGGPNSNAVQFADLTSQCDGATKSFEVPRHRYALMLSGTQFPIIYRNVTDFTTSNKTLTLTSEVGAPESGQTLVFLYIK